MQGPGSERPCLKGEGNADTFLWPLCVHIGMCTFTRVCTQQCTHLKIMCACHIYTLSLSQVLSGHSGLLAMCLAVPVKTNSMFSESSVGQSWLKFPLFLIISRKGISQCLFNPLNYVIPVCFPFKKGKWIFFLPPSLPHPSSLLDVRSGLRGCAIKILIAFIPEVTLSV